jgi:hypothetical protein
MTILNAYLMHKSYGGKMTHKKFHEVQCEIWLYKCTRRISRSVAFLEGGQVHLGPNWLD